MVQPVKHTINKGGEYMERIVVVEIAGEEKDFYSLSKEEQASITNTLNRRACERVGYREVNKGTSSIKTA